MKGFLLGLSNGVVCLTYCAPVLVPYFLSDGKNAGHNYKELFKFLAGRLSGYLLFGILAWRAGRFLPQNTSGESVFFGVPYLIFAGLLLWYGFRNKETRLCMGKSLWFQKLNQWSPQWIAFFFGLLTGLNLCPPLLLAFTDVTLSGGDLWHSLWFFFSFFAGTAVYLLPLPVLGIFNQGVTLKTIARFAMGVTGLYYGFLGLIYLIRGVQLR